MITIRSDKPLKRVRFEEVRSLDTFEFENEMFLKLNDSGVVNLTHNMLTQLSASNMVQLVDLEVTWSIR